MTEHRVKYVCERCASGDVTSDAISQWDAAGQTWIVVGHYDSGECLDCAEETNLVEVPL